MPGIHDIFEDGVADWHNAVGYFNVHPLGSPEWKAYDDGYRTAGSNN